MPLRSLRPGRTLRTPSPETLRLPVRGTIGVPCRVVNTRSVVTHRVPAASRSAFCRARWARRAFSRMPTVESSTGSHRPPVCLVCDRSLCKILSIRWGCQEGRDRTQNNVVCRPTGTLRLVLEPGVNRRRSVRGRCGIAVSGSCVVLDLRQG